MWQFDDVLDLQRSLHNSFLDFVIVR